MYQKLQICSPSSQQQQPTHSLVTIANMINQTPGQSLNPQLSGQLQFNHLHSSGGQSTNNSNSANGQQQPSGMASFVARLMSLTPLELQCLHADGELMRQLSETQLLLETKLQRLSLAVAAQKNQQLESQQQQQFQRQQQQIHQQQQQQQQSYIDYYTALSTAAYYQQHLSILSPNAHQLALDLRTSTPNQLLQFAAAQQQQQQQLYAAAAAVTSHSQQQHQLAANSQHQSSSLNYAASCSSAASSPLSDSLATDHHNNNNNNSTISSQMNNISGTFSVTTSKKSSKSEGNNIIDYHQATSSSSKRMKLAADCSYQRLHQSPAPNQVVQPRGGSAGAACTQQPPQAAATTTTTTAAKKYKGEFDEPTPEEVEQRQRDLARADNYHHRLVAQGDDRTGSHSTCACVLGSEFRDGKPVKQVLSMIERWRQLSTEERIKTKWDVSDLPKDIPLSDIKKFEELRREASRGRADFGGASKRKPLGIRGTRQFLLILYCLWGHPGRDDVMQKEGYCPHCFAKIKKANEQSTLVRVVNHFNMKHRRGANPRLSPNRDISPTLADSQLHAESAADCKPNVDQEQEPPILSERPPSSAPATPTSCPVSCSNSDSSGSQSTGSSSDYEQLVKLRVIATDSSEIHFEIQASAPMSDIKDSYASRVGESLSDLKFLFKKQRISDTDTAKELKITELDAIEVYREEQEESEQQQSR